MSGFLEWSNSQRLYLFISGHFCSLENLYLSRDLSTEIFSLSSPQQDSGSNGICSFFHCLLYERPSEEAISKWSWQRKGLLWSVKRLHLDPASVPETACCAKQKSLCANSPITHFLSPLNSAWLGNCQLSNSIEESLF